MVTTPLSLSVCVPTGFGILNLFLFFLCTQPVIPKSEPNFQVLQQSLHNFSITQPQQQSVIQPQQLLTTSQSHNIQLLQQPITNAATTTIVPNRQLTKQNNIQQQQLNQPQNCPSAVSTSSAGSGASTTSVPSSSSISSSSSSSSNNFTIADQTSTTGNNIISIASNQQKINDKIIEKMVAEIPNTLLSKFRQRTFAEDLAKSPLHTPPSLASGLASLASLVSPTNSSKNAANSKAPPFLNDLKLCDAHKTNFHSKQITTLKTFLAYSVTLFDRN